MAEAAENLQFETAAMLRDRLRAATFIQGSQAIDAGQGWAMPTCLRSRPRAG